MKYRFSVGEKVEAYSHPCKVLKVFEREKIFGNVTTRNGIGLKKIVHNAYLIRGFIDCMPVESWYYESQLKEWR